MSDSVKSRDAIGVLPMPISLLPFEKNSPLSKNTRAIFSTFKFQPCERSTSEQLLDRHPVGLSVFAKQMSEAAHKDFEKTRKRFAVSESNSAHGAKLLRATVDFGSSRT